MTQFSFSPMGLNSKPSFPKTLLSASKVNHPKDRANIIYENPHNFPKMSNGKSSTFQETGDYFKNKSIDDFLRNSAKKSVPLADLPLADLAYYNRRASHDSVSDDLEGFSHADENSSEARTTPNKKGKHSPGTYYLKSITKETKNHSRYQQDLGSTAFKTPVSKDWFQDSKEQSANNKQTTKPRKMIEQRKLNLDHEDEVHQEFEEETQDEENLDQNEQRNMRIGLASTKKDSVKRYNVFEDWRIMQAVDYYTKENGTKGILSKAVWERLVDPKTGSKVLSGTRSNESMRERYKRWLRRMTPEDREEMANFVRKHPEEYLKHYNCMFDLAQGANSGKKSLTKVDLAANSDISHEDENFLNSPPVKDSRKAKGSALNTPKFDNLTNSAVSFDKSRSIYRRIEDTDAQYQNLYDDDIQNFEDLVPVERQHNEALQNKKTKSRKSDSIVKKNFTSKQTNLEVQDVSGKKRLLNVNLYEERFNNEETNDVHHNKKIKSDSVGKSTEQIVRTIHKTPPTKKPMEEEVLDESVEEKSCDQELGSELEEFIKRKTPKNLEDMNLKIMIFVDDIKGERRFVQNPRDIKSQAKLVQFAKAYNMELKNLLEIFYSLSNDYEDLENLLKFGDDSYVWTPTDDKGLLENDATALHYLKRIKGEERIQKRKMFLLRETN